MVIFHKNEYLLRKIISTKLIGNLHLNCYISPSIELEVYTSFPLTKTNFQNTLFTPLENHCTQ